jgi:predicted aspartyl protease
MSEVIEFSEIYHYNTLKNGITVLVKIYFGNESRELNAKIDTGAENCIFERKHGERLGIDIETGKEQIFATATGKFFAYGHNLKFSVLGIETVSTVYFAKDESFTRNVLGRLGWLDRIKLGLIDYEGKLF